MDLSLPFARVMQQPIAWPVAFVTANHTVCLSFSAPGCKPRKYQIASVPNTHCADAHSRGRLRLPQMSQISATPFFCPVPGLRTYTES